MNELFHDLQEDDRKRATKEHRLNYGRLWPDTMYKADCSCGWSFGKASRESVIAAVREHEDKFL